MGYDLHITRAKHWSDEEPAICADEWLAYVDRDPELQLNGQYFAVWAGTSRHPDAWFTWSDGRVRTKNPDPAVIEKAIQIASRLGAAVQGNGFTRVVPNDVKLPPIERAGGSSRVLS